MVFQHAIGEGEPQQLAPSDDQTQKILLLREAAAQQNV